VQPLHTLFLLCFLHLVHAQDDSSNFDCHLTVGSLKYDLTALAGEHTISRTRETPPSTMVDSLRFDLCGDLKPLEGVKEGDQVRIHGFLILSHTITEAKILVSTWHAGMSDENEQEG
jgi:hypothetical protein